jgi:hypothetical protein
VELELELEMEVIAEVEAKMKAEAKTGQRWAWRQRTEAKVVAMQHTRRMGDVEVEREAVEEHAAEAAVQATVVAAREGGEATAQEEVMIWILCSNRNRTISKITAVG